MNQQRLSQATFNQANAEPVQANTAFVMVQISPMQSADDLPSFYHQLYLQALQANQSRRLPDLFCVMN